MHSQLAIAVTTRRRGSDPASRVPSGFGSLPTSFDLERYQRNRSASMSDVGRDEAPGTSGGPNNGDNDEYEDMEVETQGNTTPQLTRGRGYVTRRPAGQRVQIRRNRPRQAVFVVRDEVPIAPVDRNVMENRERDPQPPADNQNEDPEPPARVYLNVFIRSLWRASLNVLTSQEFHDYVVGLIQNIGRGRGRQENDDDLSPLPRPQFAMLPDEELPMLRRPEQQILPGPVPGPGPGHGRRPQGQEGVGRSVAPLVRQLTQEFFTSVHSEVRSLE